MKFAIKTLGCKVNIYESNYLREILIKDGFEEVDFNKTADVYVINTCTITSNADKKSKNLIKRARKINQHAIVIAVGCFIQSNQDYGDADIMIGNHQKGEIVKYIKAFDNRMIKNIVNIQTVSFDEMQISNPKQTRAFVKIQDGCDNYCSYCIIPHIRGVNRSRNIENILVEIEKLVENGYQEIVLTGINTAKYCYENNNFVDLLNQILTKTTIKRLRISSIEITEINKDFLKLLKNDRIVNHLHIPLQSGSNKILRAMNRKYTKEEFLAKIAEIKAVRPNVSLTTDVIVGFPEETEKDFAETMDLIKTINFLDVHYFPFSKRPGTKAALLKQTDSKMIKERIGEIEYLVKKINKKNLLNYCNKEVKVLFEQKKGRYLIGYSNEYLPVKVVYNKGLLNQLVNVKIKEVEYPYCVGEVN